MTRLERWSLGAILLASTCASCHTSPLVPMVWRPDTRMIWGVHLDTTAVRQTMEIFQKALPNEGAVCFAGTLRDTLFAVPDGTTVNAKLLMVARAVEAKHDSVDRFHVYGVHCGRVIAIAHSHPYSVVCSHSLPDANVLFSNPDALASIVFCGAGEAETLYADGRRVTNRWRE